MSGGTAEPADDDLVAAEYVLGTLDAAERRAFAERLRADGAAKQAVSEWEHRFAGLADRLAPVAPSPQVWTRIETALQAPPPRERAFKVVDGGGLLAEGAPRLERSRNRWRATAGALGAIAAALVAFIAVDRAGRVAPEPGGSYVAAVTRGGDKPALLVRVDLGTHTVTVLPVAAQAPPDRSLELWYIGDDKTPRAMGLVDKQPSTLAMPAGAQPGATFAVSVEPPGGSKTGGPTGPVVYSGQLVKE